MTWAFVPKGQIEYGNNVDNGVETVFTNTMTTTKEQTMAQHTRDEAGTILDRSTVDGIEYAVIVGPMGALCGYVRIPDDHPWHGKGYSYSICGHDGCYEHTPSSMVDVHGGLTFDGLPTGIEDGYWYGFDCSHAGDLVPALNDHGFSLDRDDVYRDEAYVRAECIRMAAQIAAVSA